jgi:ATP-dependent DNA ligase
VLASSDATYNLLLAEQDGSSSEGDGRLLFEKIVKMDLEGIVCKRKDSPHKVTEKPSRHWIKVKNLLYSQMEGREELFEHV